VRGLEAVRFCATLKATGVNIFRAVVVRKAFMEEVKALAGIKLGLCRAIFFSKSFSGPLGVTSTNL
jgi:hypothetical protein